MVSEQAEQHETILVMVTCFDKTWSSKSLELGNYSRHTHTRKEREREVERARHILEQQYLARHFRAPNASCLNVTM